MVYVCSCCTKLIVTSALLSVSVVSIPPRNLEINSFRMTGWYAEGAVDKRGRPNCGSLDIDVLGRLLSLDSVSNVASR